ncbi:MAG: prepilin-type N-terminal cleavage/methylation domain-containing protein [Clostridiales bacterium]|jgi:prepilin-type N-terminal cleavage/methylation domain-containing protein|nr:prepilin-type N-terminal cleavage/methylation domain-containing protein [Clostridiales bacterium]
MNQKGFSLLEVIISIATIAVISGFILQMFIVSARLNQRARDLDMGASLAVNAVETVKKASRLQDIEADSFFEGALTRMPRKEALEIVGCYDARWQRLPLSETEYQSNQYPAAACFLLSLAVENEKAIGPDGYYEFSAAGDFVQMRGSGRRYDVRSVVYRLETGAHSADDAEASLEMLEFVSLDTQKYLSH